MGRTAYEYIYALTHLYAYQIFEMFFYALAVQEPGFPDWWWKICHRGRARWPAPKYPFPGLEALCSSRFLKDSCDRGVLYLPPEKPLRYTPVVFRLRTRFIPLRADVRSHARGHYLSASGARAPTRDHAPRGGAGRPCQRRKSRERPSPRRRAAVARHAIGSHRGAGGVPGGVRLALQRPLRTRDFLNMRFI